MNPVSLAAAGALLVLLMRRPRWEESMLISAMPGYRQYARRTGRFTLTSGDSEVDTPLGIGYNGWTRREPSWSYRKRPLLI